MAIYLTGDIHGSNSVRRLARRSFCPDGLTRDDLVIVLGDFGFVWSDPEAPSDRYWLNWLEERPWTTLFIDGNHENHDLLASYPVEAWRGGSVHRIREHVIHLMRGQVFDLGGKTFFTLGGAHSHDIEYRVEGTSWWAAEAPSVAEREAAIEALERADWKVDYILTHQPPAKAMREVMQLHEVGFEPDELADWLQENIAERAEHARWFSGHLHVDAATHGHLSIYGAVVRLADDGSLEYAVESPARRLRL